MTAIKRIYAIILLLTLLLSVLVQPAYATPTTDAIDLPAPDEIASEVQGTITDGADLPADAADGGIVDDLAAAAGVLPTSLFDPDEITWSSIRGLSSAAFSDHFNAMKEDYMMIDIEVDEIDGEQRVSAVWQWNSDNRGWAEHRNLNTDQFHDKWEELRAAGYRLVDQESYILGGNRYYAGIWVQNKEGYDWASWRNLTSAEFSEKFAAMKDDYIMVDVEGYPTGAGLRYAMIWVENVAHIDWIERRNLSSEQFAIEFQQNKGQYRVWDIESYRDNGQQYYAVIWLKNDNGRGWAELRDMTATSYRNNWYRYRDLGYRLIDFEIYESGSGTRYAGVWRQNSDRPDWSLKDDVDDLVSDYFTDNNLPGIGVAVAQDGEIKYMRGFGHQDINDDVWYSARTINGLASVSKAVGGVLALNMLDDGTLTDLDVASNTLIPGLPAHHSHTLRQLLANRSGIGHYGNYNVATQSYATALAAAQTFWNVDSNPGQRGTQLVYTPGQGCMYSTHGYTFLGAALEGASGQSISQLVQNELAIPLGLPTLQLEETGSGGGNRATRYNANNNETTTSNSSWKVLGGGLEASAYDMVRFGMRVLDGTILSDDALAEMQTVPNPVPCVNFDNSDQTNYALGWNVGTQDGTPVMRKGGNWTGANTVIRLYPDEDIVVVVLTNRDELFGQSGTNHPSNTLARDIAQLLLDVEPPTSGAPPTPYRIGNLAHRVLGQAQVFKTKDGHLMMTELDTSGDDGIVSHLPENTVLWKAKVDLQTDIGSRQIMTAMLTARTGDRDVSHLRLQGGSDGLQVRASFEEPTFDVQYILDGTLVATGDDTQTATVNWDEIWCTVLLPNGLPSEICDVLIAFQQNSQELCEWNLYLPRAAVVKLSNGTSVSVNQIRLLEKPHGDHVHAAERMTFDEMEMTVANLSTLTIESVESSSESEEMAPVAFPTETQEVFLPVVLR